MIRHCDDFNEHLLAYMEREDDNDTREAMEQHAASCGECGSLLAELKALRGEAAALPELQPSRDLWSGIAERIEAPVVPIGGHVVEVKRSVRVRRWTSRILIAASLLGAAGIGYAARGTSPVAAPTETVAILDTIDEAPVTPDSASIAPTTTVAEAPESSAGSASLSTATPVATTAQAQAQARPMEVQLAARAVATLAADYDREVARLQLLLNQRRNQLDATTVAIIEKNLLVIDVAIAECKKAIAGDPASEFLIESLNQSLRTKVELMRTAALLPSRT
jgi:hypothetical protein